MTGRNPDYLKNIDLPEKLTATSDLEEACSTDTFILAVPTQSVRSFLKQAKPFLQEEIHLCNAAKGLEISTGKRISEIVAEIIPSARYSIISGPSHAEEVALSKPTAVVVASIHEEERTLWQNLLNRGFFRVYTSSDVIGVEIGGAVKNVIAIAAGIASEMDLGDNAMAALVSRGLAEVMRLGAKAGAHPLTFAGLAGLGDMLQQSLSKLQTRQGHSQGHDSRRGPKVLRAGSRRGIHRKGTGGTCQGTWCGTSHSRSRIPSPL
jgi:glycerol-3-phosphate dehydrogenase (NAD(P)+)